MEDFRFNGSFGNNLKPTASKGLTGTGLKWLAMALMLADHIGAVVLERCFMLLPSGDINMPVLFIDCILRAAGRLAFPLFCFLLVEGFVPTRDRGRYLLSLAVFALISEIPFDLAVSGSFFNAANQNVFFTLSFGFCAIWLIEILNENERERGEKKSPAVYFIFKLIAAALCCAAAGILRTDYSFMGVVLIIIFYLLRRRGKALFITAGIWLFAGDVLLALTLIAGDLSAVVSFYGLPYLLSMLFDSGVSEAVGAFSFIFINRYNGQRGNMPFSKYLFYVFYPAHLLLLALLASALG